MKKILQIVLFITIFAVFFTRAATAASCGETFTLGLGEKPEDICRCASNNNQFQLISTSQGPLIYCCGSYQNGRCYAGSVSCGEIFNPDQKNCVCSNQYYIDANTSCCGWYRDGECKNTDVAINDIEVTAETLNSLNPINIGGGSVDLSTPGGIISRALKFFVFPIAGIILFIVLVLGGFQMLTGANNSKSLEEGKARITSAIIGFILLFAAYWIAQLLEIIFGIRILS